MICGAEF